MSMREKILVGLMIAAAALGAMVLAGDMQKGGAPEAASRAPRPLIDMVTRLTAYLDDARSPENSRTILATARAPWRAGLFAAQDRLSPAAEGTPGAAPTLPPPGDLVYSGFIETPQRRVAVIDGLEYEEGDQLDSRPYTIRHIGPDQVLIEIPQQRMLAVPLVESWAVEPPQTESSDLR